ncbi:MAG: energy transducer TonB [Gemmatimonadota bacterium]
MANVRKSRTQQVLGRWDRSFRWSMVASVVLHFLLILLFQETRPVPRVDYAAAGAETGDEQAAAGGGMELLTLVIEQPPPAPEAEPVPEVPVPVPVEVPEPVPDPVREPERSTSGQGSTSAAGQGTGESTGAGTQTGTGTGAGGDAEGGSGIITAPSPRGLILPPSDRPGSVRGRTVTVYVFVDPRGGVVRDSTRLNPSTGDSRFDDRLRQQAADWKFRPATQRGQAVAAWFPYTITF